MKYYIDTEFNEGFHKAFMKPNRHFIDLISIGIVAEDGREYYSIAKEFDIYAAFNKHEVKVNSEFKPQQAEGEYNPMYIKEYWLRDNVLKPIWFELYTKEYEAGVNIEFTNEAADNNFTYLNFKKLIKKYGKTNKQIAEEIEKFVGKCSITSAETDLKLFTEGIQIIEKPEFYAYYADYDWVAFCSLFGSMMQLPSNFPMFCKDLKQTLDETQESWLEYSETEQNSYCLNNKLYSVEQDLKCLSNYPKQENEHNALEDAKWNKKLHEFLKSI